MKEEDSPISVEAFETTSNQLKFLKDRRSLMAARITAGRRDGRAADARVASSPSIA